VVRVQQFFNTLQQFFNSFSTLFNTFQHFFNSFSTPFNSFSTLRSNGTEIQLLAVRPGETRRVPTNDVIPLSLLLLLEVSATNNCQKEMGNPLTSKPELVLCCLSRVPPSLQQKERFSLFLVPSASVLRLWRIGK
jgi:hypothetical protein